jgi:DNA-binding transcriptional ArsR family regulator
VIEEKRLDLENVVLHRDILEILKTLEGQSVIVFDNSSSLILSDPKKIDKVLIRSFVEKLKERGVIQIWSCPESKRTKILPEDCFDFIFGVEPEKEAKNVAFMVRLERNAYFYQEKLLQFNLELQPDENGKQTLVEKDLMFDKRYLAIGLAAQGKTQAEIGEYLGKDQSTISHWLRKAENDGLISRNGNKYTLTQKGRKVQPGRNQR